MHPKKGGQQSADTTVGAKQGVRLGHMGKRRISPRPHRGQATTAKPLPGTDRQRRVPDVSPQQLLKDARHLHTVTREADDGARQRFSQESRAIGD
jgi:hypothetical protein